MTKDKPPRKPSETERRVMREQAAKRAQEFAAVRLRILGPSTAPPPEPIEPPRLDLKADDHSNDDLNLPHTY